MSDSAVIEIAHETTLKFGDKREPENDVLHPFDNVGDAPIPLAAARPQVVIVAPAADAHLMFGRYRLVERLSEGGMSELFIAKAAGVEGFTRIVRAQAPAPELARDKDAVAQFIDEARLQADLVHSNVVPVFDFGVVGGEYFMTQEYIVGRDVARLMDASPRARPAGPADAGGLLRRARDAAGARASRTAGASAGRPAARHRSPRRRRRQRHRIARGRGEADRLRHREVERLRQPDAGRHRQGQRELHVARAGARPGRRRAQRSLLARRCVLYYCLTGELLYDGQNDLEVLHHAAGGLLREDFARIRRLPDPAPQILERALALDPNARYQRATEFIDAMAVHMGGGRNGLAQLMRELFANDLQHQRALPAAAAVGYTAGP